MRSIEILGCRLDMFDAQAAAQAILHYAREKRGAQIVTLGTEMVVYAQSDPRYRAVINGCALSLCDTVGLLTVARGRGAVLRDRVTGVELLERLCKGAAEQGLAVYLLGGAPGVAEQAAEVLKQRYPGLRVAGTHDGYFAPAESSRVAQGIRATGAQLLFAAMGFPKQEFWLAEHLHETGAGAAIGVGGSFDVVSGRVERAPQAWRKAGLEWLYRLVKEPRRWRRQLALPRFVILIAVENVRNRLAGVRPNR